MYYIYICFILYAFTWGNSDLLWKKGLDNKVPLWIPTWNLRRISFNGHRTNEKNLDQIEATFFFVGQRSSAMGGASNHNPQNTLYVVPNESTPHKEQFGIFDIKIEW